MCFDEPFTRYLVGDLGDVVMGKATLEVLFKSGFQSCDADEWVLRPLIADDATDFFFNWSTLPARTRGDSLKGSVGSIIMVPSSL
jgi:hypothetical protein